MLTGAKREWDNCFIENAHKITRILPDFICKKPIFSLFPFWADAYESYTMMAKPIRALELHYPMIQFLIILFTPLVTVVGKFVHLKTACIWAVQLILAL